MALRDEIVSTILKIIYDKSSGDAANKELSKTRSYIEDITAAAKDVTLAAPEMSESIAKNSEAAAGKVLTLRDAYLAVAKAQKDTAKGASSGSTLNAVGNIGQVGSRALGAIGLGQVGQALNSVGDLADVSHITDDVKDLVKSIAPLQGLAEGLTPALGATGAAFASLGLVIAPIAAVVLAITAAIKLLQEASEAGAKAEKDRFGAENQQVQAQLSIRQKVASMNREQLAAEYDNLNYELTLRNQQLEAAKARKAEIDQQYSSTGDPFARNRLAGEGSQVDTDMATLTTRIVELQSGLSDTVGATESATLAERELADERTAAANTHLDTLQKREQAYNQILDLEATGTEKQAQSQLEANQRQIQALEVYSRAAADYAATLQQGSEENARANEIAQDYNQQIEDLTATNQRLTDSTIPLLQQREAEAQLAGEQKKQFEDAGKAAQKFNADVDALSGKLDENRTKLAETLDGILEQAQKAAEAALEKLQQRRAELITEGGRDEEKAERDKQAKLLDIAIEGQRAEADAYKNYRRTLASITRKADFDAFSLALNRDFAGLFQANRQTDFDKNTAAIDERQAIEDTRESRQRNVEDLIRSNAQEANERHIALAQRIQDEITAYQQERIQIEANRADAEKKAIAASNRQREILQAQINARAEAAQKELSIISLGESTKLQLQHDAYQSAIGMAQQFFNALSNIGHSSGGGGAGRGRALGGGLAAFMTSNVNENSGQRESFTTGGRSFALPGGAGLFTPFKSGNVNANGGGGQNIYFSQTNNITGSNLEGIADMIDKRTIKLVKRIVGVEK